MKTQVLVVGFGIAGANIAYHLKNSNIDFVVLDEERAVTSSKVAAGLMNPVTGRRIVKTWLANEIFPFAEKFYRQIEKDLDVNILYKRNGFRFYKDISDQNDMLAKVNETKYQGFLNDQFDDTIFDDITTNQFGGIEILQSGNLDVKNYLKAFKKHLHKKSQLINEPFDFSKFSSEKKTYNEIEFDHIIFCEGYRAMYNPLFKWLPFAVTKGETLTIKADLPESHIINKGFYILPTQKEKEFLVGASYERVINEDTSEKGRNIVKEKLDNFLKIDYKIIDQNAAIRPTVKDRRPFIGTHPDYRHIHIFNGMGTKGITLSPFFSQMLVENIFKATEIHKEADIARYFSLYSIFKKEASES